MLRAEARIDADAIARNCARLREVAGTRLCAVVKAEGYGHGAVTAARAARRGGADWLAVATAEEARALGDDGPLLVMGAISAEELPVALEARAEVVVWRREFLDRLPDGARVHVKLDTGMGRLGTRDVTEAIDVAREAARRGMLVGAMTHFATSDDDPGFAREQLRSFAGFLHEIDGLTPDLIAHAANSAAALGIPESRLDLVRCGIAAYGLDPFQRDPADQGLEPAMTLASYVAEVKPIAAGQSAGYGRTYVAERDGLLATLPIGYADGVRRALSNNADVLIRGRRFPLAGTVSMDNITVAVDDSVQRGDEAILIGAQGDERILAEEWAETLGTINYEITCGVSARVPRT
ncbi:MAG: alanine racemase [Solirubrobacteraceae bacterium]|jgi:alanine racemase|nr:alanine racemase [Solirubrobacteraceae bacterium]